MSAHIVDELRPELPDIDPVWENETLRSIIEGRHRTTEQAQPRRWRDPARIALAAAAVLAVIGGTIVASHLLPPASRDGSDTVAATLGPRDPSATADPADLRDASAATWELAPRQSIAPSTRRFEVLVARVDCNNGITGEVLPPHIAVNDEDEIALTFVVKPKSPQAARCPSNRPERFLVDLNAPLGDRPLVDGQCEPGGEAVGMSFCEPGGTRWSPSAGR